METSVKFFSSTMLGAPVISGTKGSLVAALDACMVTGFGLVSASSVTVASGVATVILSTGNFVQHQIILVAGATPAGLNGEKRVIALTGASSFTFDATGVVDGVATGAITVKTAPLGWVKAFAGTNSAAYKIDAIKYPDTTGAFVRVSDNGNYCAQIVGYESMSSIDIGVGAFPTASQASTQLWVFRSDTIHPSAVARAWFIVGDERFVYYGNAHVPNSAYCWAGFGEFKSNKSADPFRFAIWGNATSDGNSAINVNNTLMSPYNLYGYAMRSSLGLGSSVKLYLQAWGMAYGASMVSGGSGTSLPYPNPSDYGLYLSNVSVLEVSPLSVRAALSGLYFVPQKTGGLVTPSNTIAYFDTAVPGFTDKLMGFVPCGESASNYGVVAFDLTGPWEH